MSDDSLNINVFIEETTKLKLQLIKTINDLNSDLKHKEKLVRKLEGYMKEITDEMDEDFDYFIQEEKIKKKRLLMLNSFNSI